jgi:glucose-1-phosphate thymidylyltransferase
MALEVPEKINTMNIIIPMAGRGSRLRPHTLTVPKPLIPVGGKPIVHRLVEDIVAVCGSEIQEIAFVVGHFGEEVERELIAVAEMFGARGSIHYQETPLGTGHAVLCAKNLLKGPVVVAFADTLFNADFKISPDDDGILWVKQIENPSDFGVVKLNSLGEIVDYIEKPKEFISDLAMIGVYYFREGEKLRQELEYLVSNNIIKSGEYQLPDALRRLTEKGCLFKPGAVNEWLDCGNKDVTVHTNSRVLDYDFQKNPTPTRKNVRLVHSIIIEPCFIDENVLIENSIIGPHVSIGKDSTLMDCRIADSILQNNCTINNMNITNSMIGSHVILRNTPSVLSIGDFSTINE